MRQCQDNPPGQLLLAIRQFNAEEWFECHETLEDLWVGEEGEVRDLFQGIIQIAVALHHWRNGNFAGAVRLLEGGVRYLGRVEGPCLWLDVAGLIEEADRVRSALNGLGRDRMDELDPALIPRLRTVTVRT